MAHRTTFMIASAIAVATTLAGCGGGGGGGGVAFTPPPPSTPTPTPTPTPSAASIGAPAIAAVPNAHLFPNPQIGGPTMQSHPITVFPLLQSVVKISSAGLVADTATIDGGATLEFNATGDLGNDSYAIDIANPALGMSDEPLLLDWCGLCAQVGNNSVSVDIPDPASSNLSWTTYGMWGVHVDFGPPATTRAAFVTGYATPVGSVPTVGTATYNGLVTGQVMYPAAGQENGVGYADLSGDASLQANFGTGSITGSLTNMMAGLVPWNSVSLLGAISGGQNYFSGTSSVTSAPANNLSLNGSATGTFAGMFFGPVAQELGAVWTLSDGTSAAIGSIGAKTGP